MVEKKTDKTEEILRLMQRGVPVYTVNRRLARHLASEYDSYMLSQGRGAWTTPAVMPAAAWFEGLWREAMPQSPVLNRGAARVLWERVVNHDLSGTATGLLLPKGAARTAYRAYALMLDYRLQLPRDEIYLTEEALALKRWTRSYERELKRLGFMDGTAAVAAVPSMIRQRLERLPERVVLAGFDDLTPLVKDVVSALEERGVAVEFWPGPPGGRDPDGNSGLEIYPYDDLEAEVLGVARWIRSVAAPGVRIGIVVPELERYRETIEREFSAELDPASSLSPQAAHGPVFNISLGIPLHDEPLVSSAVGILSVGLGRMDAQRLMHVLRSPYISERDDDLALALIDTGLRAENRISTGLMELRERAARAAGPRLEARLGRWIDSLGGMRGAKRPQEWARDFSVLLDSIGWLVPVELDSREYQALEAWHSLLEGFSALGEITGPVSREEAVGILVSIARETIHQPETPGCGVQVLGLLESTGLDFDHIWMMGCHELAFPALPSPNPFIPLYLQKKAGVPHASARAELDFSTRVLARLLGSAPSIRASWPQQYETSNVRVSPLLKVCGRVCEAPDLPGVRLKDAVHSGYGLEPVAAEDPLPVTDAELRSLSGGTAIIKDQSLCPFRAFAAHRLGARALAEPAPGLSAAERGTVLHVALRLFWEKVEDSETLKALVQKNEIDGCVAAMVEKAFASSLARRAGDSRFMEMEKERFRRLIREWLEVEAARGPFRVKTLEAAGSVEIAGLRITGRPDRIDEVDGGGEVIIDYKSGNAGRTDWISERPLDPQLLVYTMGGRFDAVSFARLKPGETRFIGIARDAGLLPGVRALEDERWTSTAGVEADWDRLMESWHRIVERLAREFMEGHSEVDPAREPYDRAGPCMHCDLAALCRINEDEERGGDDEAD